MVDKAYDAFSQGRDTGTKARVTERRSVGTLTDPNRYQMPPSRRLRVAAKTKDMFVNPEKDGITRFAESLAEVQPQLMDYLTTKQAEENKEEIQAGIEMAMANKAMENGDTEFADSKWKKFGFDYQTTYAQAEAYGQQLQLDLAKKPPLQDFDEWYTEYHKQRLTDNPELANVSPDHLEIYNKVMSKSIVEARAASMVTQDNEETRIHLNSSTKFTQGTIEEAISNGVEVNNALIETIINDQIVMNRWNRDQANQIVFNAISNIALGQKDPNNEGEWITKPNLEVLSYLTEGRGPDGKLASVAKTKGPEYRALESKVYARLDKIRADENNKVTTDARVVTGFQTTMEDKLKLVIGEPESFLDIPGATGGSPRQQAATAINFAMEDYNDAYSHFLNVEKYSPAESHKMAMEQILSSDIVKSNTSAAYQKFKDYETKERKASFAWFETNKERFEEREGNEYRDYLSDLHTKVAEGTSWGDLIPEWNMKNQDGSDFLNADHKKIFINEAKQAAFNKQLDDASTLVKQEEDMKARVTAQAPMSAIHKSASGEVITEPVVTEEERAKETYVDENPKTTTLTAEEEKAYETMYAKSKEREDARRAKEAADAGRLEIEFDTDFEMVPNIVKGPNGGPMMDGFKENPSRDRVVEEGYEALPSDNQGLQGYDPINKKFFNSNPNKDPNYKFGYKESGITEAIENFIEPADDAVVEKFNQIKEIFNRPVPDSIEVNPMGDAPVESETKPMSTEGKVFNPAENRWVVETPQVETNPNVATVTAEDKSALNSFQEKLKISESSGDYAVVNDEGYMGAYQFGNSRLKDFKKATNKKFNKKEFLSNPELQDEAFEWHVQDYRDRIKKKGLDKYVGTEINGVPVTMDGLVAVAHLGGFTGMTNFLRFKGRGKSDEADSNGTTMTDYLRKFKT